MSHDDEARALMTLYDERVELTRQMSRAEQLTGAMVEAAIAKGDELDAACEAFRRKHYPRRFRVVSSGGEVFTVSRTGRVKMVVVSAAARRAACRTTSAG